MAGNARASAAQAHRLHRGGTQAHVPEYAVSDYVYAIRLGLAFGLLGVVLLFVAI
ncbi:MAG: hypothetical protein ACM3SS_18230 [Rhodospirillaceae bacterium]